jgi:hypothetical protein
MSLGESFSRSAFARFMGSPAGRVVRVAGGLALLALGWPLLPGAGGVALAFAGLAVLAAGVFNLCYLRSLLGGPLRGA